MMRLNEDIQVCHFDDDEKSSLPRHRFFKIYRGERKSFKN